MAKIVSNPRVNSDSNRVGPSPVTLQRIVAFVGIILVVSLVLFAQQSFADETQASVPEFDVPLIPGWVYGLLLAAVVLFNALCVAGEATLEALRPMMSRNGKEDIEGNQRIATLQANRTQYLNSLVVGHRLGRVIGALLAFLMAPGIALYFQKAFGWEYSFGSVLVGAVLVLVPTELVNLFLGDLLSRSYAQIHPYRMALGLYPFAQTVKILMFPVAWPLAKVDDWLSARFGSRSGQTAYEKSSEELLNLVESAEEAGEIEADQKELLHSVFDFTTTIAREVMTPRVDMDAMPIESDPAVVIDLIRESGHSRIPLYDGTDDQIIGIVHAKDLLMAQASGKPIKLRSLMRAPIFVPENRSLHELLSDLRSSKAQMAIVQDEFGGTAGIVTIEDVVEELVGDIVDEYDKEEPEVVPDGDGWIVQGKVHWDDLNDAIGSQFDSSEFDTIGGLVFGLFGRQPRPNEQVESEGYLITVIDTDGRRIQRLRIERANQEEAPEEE